MHMRPFNGGRRHTIKMLSALVAVWHGRMLLGSPVPSPSNLIVRRNNFKAVFGNAKLRQDFYSFLKNVYHIYPEAKFHKLIIDASEKFDEDSKVYTEVQKRLPKIKPLFADLTLALPALAKQKEEMGHQTASLLTDSPKVRGYLEIGTPGRYVKSLQKQLKMEGAVYLMHDREPRNSIEDIAERGQIAKAGTFLPLSNYAGIDAAKMANGSVDLVTNYIGFHHSPAPQLDGFVRSSARVLRPGGHLILRDHNVGNDEMYAMVGLAHDVFNAGLKTPWETNASEIRNFTSTTYIETYLAERGLFRKGPGLLQDGDPTLNTLMLFERRNA